jgi:hypothetical protein
VQQGYDVFLENWRASIDVPQSSWSLDHAAVYDHPAAVQKIVDVTGAKDVKATIHWLSSQLAAQDLRVPLAAPPRHHPARAAELRPPRRVPRQGRGARRVPDDRRPVRARAVAEAAS